MSYALIFGLGIWVTIPALMIWYLILPKTYFLTFNGEIPSRLSIFTHYFLSFLLLFMILGLGFETAVKYPEGPIAPTFIFCVYFGRNKINLGDKKRRRIQAASATV